MQLCSVCLFRDQSCAWIITSPSPNDRIIINVEEVASEGAKVPCNYDYVIVYDGGSIYTIYTFKYLEN